MAERGTRRSGTPLARGGVPVRCGTALARGGVPIRSEVVAIHPVHRDQTAKIDISQGLLVISLKGMYDELLEQPVPDHLTDIVRRLES